MPFIITSAVREVERRGIAEVSWPLSQSSRFQDKMSIPQVGIYRVNGSAVDMGRLKRAFESNPYEAEQLLKECDIHAVAGILKQYLR